MFGKFFRLELLLHSRIEQIKRSGCTSEFAGDIDSISWSSARTKDHFAFRDRSHNHDVGKNTARRLCRVSSGKRHVELIRETQQPFEESINP